MGCSSGGLEHPSDTRKAAGSSPAAPTTSSIIGRVAQQVEQGAEVPRGGGSTPSPAATLLWERRKRRRTGFGSRRLQVRVLPSRPSASVVQRLERLASTQTMRVRFSPGALFFFWRAKRKKWDGSSNWKSVCFARRRLRVRIPLVPQKPHTSEAQSAEQRPPNPPVAGSNPAGRAMHSKTYGTVAQR